MKKMLLLGMLVVSGLSFGRDYEHRERMEIEELMNKPRVSQEMSPRERASENQNMEKYSDFHWELMNMDRGNERR